MNETMTTMTLGLVAVGTVGWLALCFKGGQMIGAVLAEMLGFGASSLIAMRMRKAKLSSKSYMAGCYSFTVDAKDYWSMVDVARELEREHDVIVSVIQS